MTQEPKLATPAAAAYIGFPEATLRSWAKAGRVPYSVTPSGRMFFDVADLDQMVRVVEPTKAVS